MQQHDIVINNIVNLTSQRDTNLLALSLFISVAEIVKASTLSILHISNREKPTSLIKFKNKSCIKKSQNIAVEDKLLQAFKYIKENSLTEHLIEGPSNYQYIKLLQDERRGHQFLLIDLSNKLSDEQLYSLAGTIKIYKNFVDLLIESQTDELTGLANRKTFDSSISQFFVNNTPTAKYIEHDRRSKESMKNTSQQLHWIAVIDIDDFKRINDDFGHLYGDEILIHLSQIIRKNFRVDDLQFRFGGEEFVILLKSPSKEQIFKILNRFREEVANYDFPNVGQVTVSIGATEFVKGIFHVTLIDYADQALYYSKKKGKNCLTFFEDMLESGASALSKIEGGEVDLF